MKRGVERQMERDSLSMWSESYCACMPRYIPTAAVFAVISAINFISMATPVAI